MLVKPLTIKRVYRENKQNKIHRTEEGHVNKKKPSSAIGDPQACKKWEIDRKLMFFLTTLSSSS